MASQETYAAIAKNNFPAICEENIPQYLSELENEDPENLKGLAASITQNLRDKCIEQFPDYKIILHVILLKKGECSLIEDWEMYYEVMNDCLSVWQQETEKFHILAYGVFIPLKVPQDFYKK